MAQLPLSVALDGHAVFDTFHAGVNKLAVDALKHLRSPGVWLWGCPGSGKSHLLQAVAVAEDSLYLPLGSVQSHRALEGLDNQRVVVIDDIDRVLGQSAWEHALFELYNVVVGAGGSIVASAAAAPAHSAVTLPDLASRLRALPVFHLSPLDDSDRAAALRLRAEHRGLNVSARTVQYLIHHTDRDMRSLYSLLDQLDRATLSAGRKLTIPFVKSFLDDAPAE